MSKRKPKSVRAWHFVGATLRNGSPIPPDGKWLEYPGDCIMCYSGLHASRDPFDALQYAPGAMLCLVECDQLEKEDADKFVCHRRRIIARKDVTGILRWFARMQALSVIHLWASDPPDVVLDWLMTGDETIMDAAWDAAWAAGAAAGAAGAAAKAAAWDPAGAAVDAAWAAAWAAGAAGAAGAAARAAVDAAAKLEFNSLIHAEFAEWLR